MEIRKERYEIFCQMMENLDIANKLMNEYDSFPHEYGDEVLYQVESHVIQAIGRQEGMTVTDLSVLMGRTISACSQCIRKLRDKGWIEQIRNEENNREYKLYLTEDGWNIFNDHERLDQACYERNCAGLNEFSDEDLEIYNAIQKKINESFQYDVSLCKQNFGRLKKY